ncbi:Ig-like domain-containing protein [Aeromonas hydrophila]|uniref:Ig-like domain-containing protein n=1 Tax=Aeromonas hydrophila TaxID=644 RepID=UPI003F7AF00E
MTETITVNVNVGEVDNPTAITGDTSGEGAEDGGAIVGTLSATDADGLADGTVFGVSGNPANGTATIDPVATGAWSYTPVADWHGNDSFTVTITMMKATPQSRSSMSLSPRWSTLQPIPWRPPKTRR